MRFLKLKNWLKLKIFKYSPFFLKSLEPVSRDFGFDMGNPIDRYYIEDFLSKNKNHIKGAVLEIGESTYSKMFDNGVTSFEVLHVSNDHPNATIIGDLTNLKLLPEERADCFICTQTLNFIFDFNTAIRGGYQLLKKGGVMLCTVAGVCQISRYDANRWGDYWRFNPQGIERAFAEVFGQENITVDHYGNYLSASALLNGVPCDILKKNELDHKDQDYPVIVTVIAKKT